MTKKKIRKMNKIAKRNLITEEEKRLAAKEHRRVMREIELEERARKVPTVWDDIREALWIEDLANDRFDYDLGLLRKTPAEEWFIAKHWTQF